MSTDARDLLIELDRIRSVVDSLATRMYRFRSESLPELGRTDIGANFAAQLLDNTYTALEPLFLRVSQFFENSLAQDRWHADLDWRKLDFPLDVYDRVLPLVKADIRRSQDFLLRLAAD